MGVNMSIPAAYDECLSQTEQLEWLYKHKENLLTAGANIKITRSGDTVIIAAEGEGFSPTVNVEVIPGGHRVTITDGEGPHVFDVMDGAPGQDGRDGTDGTSVSFSTQAIQGGTRVFLEDGTHSSNFDVMDGTDGEDITITDVSVISAGTQVTFSDDTVIVIPNGLTGPQGLPGTNGRNVFIKYADAQPTQDSDMKDIPSAFMGVYSGTATTAPTTYTDYLWYQIKGTKGDTGSQGPAGVSPSLSSEPISGGHRVSMTDAEGTTTFDVMDGENAAAATVTVGSTTTGEPGTNASVTNSGTSSDAVLNFVIPRGAKGDTGSAGSKGDKGDTGETPAITMSATADATSSATPSVTVTKTGTDEAPNFALAFSGLKGAAGPAGEGVPAHTSSEAGKVLGVDANGDTEWQTPSSGLPAGGTTGQVVTKTASGAEWANVPTELPSGGSVGQVLTKNSSGCAWSNIPAQLPTSGTTGYVLTKTSSGNAWQAAPTELPSGGSTGQILTKTSSGVAWQTPSGSVSPQLFTDLYDGSMTGTSNATINLTTPSATKFKLLVDRIKVGNSEYSRIKPTGFVVFSTSGSATVNFVTLTIARTGSYTWNGNSYNYSNWGDFPEFLQYTNASIVTSTDNVVVASHAYVRAGASKIEISVYPYKSVSANCSWTIHFG